jgi:hypothetical protein
LNDDAQTGLRLHLEDFGPVRLAGHAATLDEELFISSATLSEYVGEAELAEQAADKAEKEQARELPKEVEEELIPSTPERPTTPVQRKRTYTLVERTPGKPPTIGRPTPSPALDGTASIYCSS